MTGTLINVGGILAGGLLGLLLKSRLPERVGGPVMKAEGVAILIIALNGLITSMIRVEGGGLSNSGNLLLLVSLVAGCLTGELVGIEDRLSRLGKRVEDRFGAVGFSKGFVTASLIFCVGAMSIIGPLNDGLKGDASILLVKAALDATTAALLASVLGYGVLFAAVPVLLLQGGVSLLAHQIAPILSVDLLTLICMVGYAIVLCIGLNFAADTGIKTANLLPALAVPILYYAGRALWTAQEFITP